MYNGRRASLPSPHLRCNKRNALLLLATPPLSISDQLSEWSQIISNHHHPFVKLKERINRRSGKCGERTKKTVYAKWSVEHVCRRRHRTPKKVPRGGRGDDENRNRFAETQESICHTRPIRYVCVADNHFYVRFVCYLESIQFVMFGDEVCHFFYFYVGWRLCIWDCVWFMDGFVFVVFVYPQHALRLVWVKVFFFFFGLTSAYDLCAELLAWAHRSNFLFNNILLRAHRHTAPMHAFLHFCANVG